MEKLKLQSADMAERNIEMLGQMFPDCLTEAIDDDGKVVRAIDFDKLRQEVACDVVEGADERYQFTWPDKRKAIRMANAPTTKTLRPCREESVDFDNTENLYIEGDNLEVLKLLRENYLGKVKMIYIDPPYNTGNDFVYNDDFRIKNEEFMAHSGLFDDEGRRMADPMVQNTESNGRFHTDWLNMIYPRLKVAKDLLSDDGVIFISIDDNEVGNLRKVCDEVFGERNFVAQYVWEKKKKPSFLNANIGTKSEYILCYSKNRFELGALSVGTTEEGKKYPLNNAGNSISILTFPPCSVRFNIPDGRIVKQDMSDGNIITELLNDVTIKNGLNENEFQLKGEWRYSQSKLTEIIANHETILISKVPFRPNHIKKGGEVKKMHNLLTIAHYNVGTNEDATSEQIDIFGMNYFDYAKPSSLIKLLLKSISYNDDNALALDFFSGSATTAHAVMQLNAEDGGKRKFIMVQLPELTDEKSEAYKTGYKNICEIGKERIRRAGKKILNELGVRNDELGIKSGNGNGELGVGNDDNSKFRTPNSKLDIGFRVLKLDESNMKDVYYTPAETPIDAQQEMVFDGLVDNIREGRTAEDLLFQVLPECNLPLSSKIEERELYGKRVFVVNDGYLVACFDSDINESVITAIAKQRPYYFVMCDRSMATDNVADNFDQIFDAYSKETIRRVL